MLSPTQYGESLQLFRTAERSWTSSARTRRSLSVHKPAIDRLDLELDAREGLICRFHAGVAWGSTELLLQKGVALTVERERALRLGNRRYVPDLTIRCARTSQIVLLIEVWNSHAVSTTKARAFGEAQIPWIEVKASHVLARPRSGPLPVLDWGGPGLPSSPHQAQILAALTPSPSRRS
jgi:hypothetical protein